LLVFYFPRVAEALITGHSRCIRLLRHYSTRRGPNNIYDSPTGLISLRQSYQELRYLRDFIIPETVKDATQELKGVAGNYAIFNTINGRVYIGSSINIGLRLINHLVYNNPARRGTFKMLWLYMA